MDSKSGIQAFQIAAASSQAWDRWKQTLEFYFTAEKITDARQKQAKLILLGGKDIQNLFYSFPTVTQYPTGHDAYTYTLECLDSKIGTKSTKWYERYLLSQVRQNKDESATLFITRVRNQAQKCEFADTFLNEAIQGQLINGCTSNELRTELMRAKKDAKLEAFESLAYTFEAVTAQSSAIASNSNSANSTAAVCNVQQWRKRKPWKNDSKKQSVDNEKVNNGLVTCFNCGREGHKVKDPKCPALGATCSKCKRKGHFAKYCRCSNQAATSYSSQSKVKSVGVEEEEIFCIRGGNLSNRDEIVSCKIGGVTRDMFIDSGSKYSIVSIKEWRRLQRSSAFEFKQFLPNSVSLVDASGKVKYTVYKTALVTVECNGHSRDIRLVIVRENLPALLGREDGKHFGVLRVGVAACSESKVYTVAAVSTKPLGKLKDFQLRIPIDHSVAPVIQPIMRVPYGLRPVVEHYVNEYLNADIIEPVTTSRWVSPLVLAPKGETAYRPVVDLRRANEAVMNEKHPMPTIEDFQPHLKDATVFSKIDLRQAYHQIELSEESREITTFWTHLGLFRFKRLAEGLKCAPEMFQRILENTLAGLSGVFNYLDDLLIFGSNETEHDSNLEAVMKRLREVGLEINETKSKFRQTEVTFIGHVISKGTIKPMLNKVKAIREFRFPESNEELNSFLGLVSYVGKFIPHLSTQLDYLRKVARTKPFVWSEEASQCFIHVQSLLSEESSLHLFDTSLPTTVMADASPVGLGAVLLQHKGSEVRVICYVSRSLSPVERKYSQTEKEALALVFAVERLKYYLLGREFDLITDHKPLEVIFGSRSKPCARLERWLLRLQCYKYTVRYAPGKNNIADPLSRLLEASYQTSTLNNVYENNLVMFVEELVPKAVTLRAIREATAADPELKTICDDLRLGRIVKTKPYNALMDELCVVDNVLLRGTRIVVPPALRKGVLANAHEGHPGIVKMKNRLRSKVWWPRIDSMAEQVARTCDACQKVNKNITIEQMARRKLPDGPWQDLAIDFKSLPMSNKSICVLVDYFSRYIELKIFTTTTAKDTIDFLTEAFARHGLPYSITSDNGGQFISGEFDDFCNRNGIVHYTTPPYWAQANGEVERQNGTLQKIIQIAQLTKKNVEKEINDYLLMYRSTPHSVTGKSPAELLFNRKIRDKLPTLKERVEETAVRDADAYQKAKSVIASNPRITNDKSIEVGDEVLIQRPFTKNKGESKFEEETGTVTAVNGPEVVVETPTKTMRRHINQIENYNRSNEEGNFENESVLESQPATSELRQSSRSTKGKPPKWLTDYAN